MKACYYCERHKAGRKRYVFETHRQYVCYECVSSAKHERIAQQKRQEHIHYTAMGDENG